MMGRKRQSGERLPKYVYPKRGWYIWRPYVDGKLCKPVKLVRVDAPMSDVWFEYERLQDPARNTIAAMMRRFLRENQKIADRTRKDYKAYARILAETPLRGGQRFGDLDADALTPPAVRRYLDRFSDTPTAADRRIQFLKAAYSWAFERGRVKRNPCVGVRLHNQGKSDRYVEDRDYYATLETAKEFAAAGRYPYACIMMEFAYLLRARRSEVERLRRQDVDGDVLKWERGKGSRPEWTEITPRLLATINAGKKLDDDIASPWLVHNRGRPITKNAFDSAWQRIMKQAVADRGVRRFTFHAIKAKGVSDHAAHHSGHRSERMRDHYSRKPDEIKATR